MLPLFAVLGPIPPIPADGSPRALPFAHQKKAATCAPVIRLRSPIESQIALVAGRIGFDETNALLVRAAAIARLPVALDALHRFGCVGIACSPGTAGFPILPGEQSLHFLEQIEMHPGKAFLDRGKG